jgi:hypothetical protein
MSAERDIETGIQVNDFKDNPGNQDLKLSINPNPVTDQAVISFYLSNDEYIRINMVDTRGRIIMSIFQDKLPGGMHNISYDVSESKRVTGAGIYFITVLTKNGFSSVKMVVYD